MSIRPVFRVASAGLDPRDLRLIEIVFRHSQYNKYDFQMLEDLNLTRTDILIANPGNPVGLDALTAVGSCSRRIPSVSAVPRGAQTTARHSITIDRLTLQLLPILNRVVEVEMLEPPTAGAEQPLGDELTDIYCDGAAPVLAEIPTLNRQPDPASQPLSAGRFPRRRPQSGQSPCGQPSNGQSSNGQLLSPVVDRPAMTTASASETAANAIAHAADRAASDGHHRHVSQPYLPQAGQAAQPPSRARLQALIADPSVAAQQQLARALRRIGLEVQCVASAADALQSLAAQHVDLVITERGLTDTDGFDLVRQMRTQIAYRYTPVLLLRSRLHVMDATRARIAGNVAVLTKPLTRQQLESVVRETLRNSVILDDLSELLSPG